MSATGTGTNGWVGGGIIDGPNTSTVQRITYSTDTATASVRGPLALATRGSGSTSDGTTYGWFGGGYSPPAIADASCVVSRITFATDTATASTRGPLSSARRYLSGTGTTTDGWFGGGYSAYAPTSVITSTVQRITYATDTSTASVRGPLSAVRYGPAATGDNTTYGWFAGGSSGPLTLTTIDRITYATDTATASVRGPLNTNSRLAGASTDGTTYGWFGGGFYINSPTPGNYGASSLVQRITYATDTATASVRGPLSSGVYKLSGTSGIA
jgi:hypothetical protein